MPVSHFPVQVLNTMLKYELYFWRLCSQYIFRVVAQICVKFELWQDYLETCKHFKKLECCYPKSSLTEDYSVCFHHKHKKTILINLRSQVVFFVLFLFSTNKVSHHHSSDFRRLEKLFLLLNMHFFAALAHFWGFSGAACCICLGRVSHRNHRNL